MQYDVYIGDTALYGVTDVKSDAERDIETYDGIGKGTFSVAGSKELRIWDIQCELSENNDHHHSDWTPAQTIFDAFEQMLADESEQRLVISSEDNNISELALLKSYTKTEKEYQGVYDVSIRLMEYVPVSVRTTDVPYVKRPGKVPVPPTVTFNGGTVTPYSVAQGLGMAAGGVAGLNGTVMGSLNGGGAHYTLGGRVSGGSGVKLTDNNGKPIDNPNMLENGIEYIMKPIREEDHAGAAAGYALGWVKKAFEAAGNLLRSGSD